MPGWYSRSMTTSPTPARSGIRITVQPMANLDPSLARDSLGREYFVTMLDCEHEDHKGPVVITSERAPLGSIIELLEAALQKDPLPCRPALRNLRGRRDT